MDREIDKLVVRGFWGPRKEADSPGAQRWLTFLERLGAVIPGAPTAPGGWKDAEGGTLPARIDAVASHIEARSDPADIARGLGYVFSAISSVSGGVGLAVLGSTGMTKASTVLTNSIVVEIRAAPGSGADLGVEWLPLATATLEALVEAWDPDWGVVADRALRDHLEMARGRPRRTPDTGWVTYLSSGRAALVPSDLAGSRRSTRTGGVLVDLVTDEGSLPSHDTVLVLDTSLHSTPAYDPVPADAPHLGDPTNGPSNGVSDRRGDGGGMRLRNLRYPPTPANAGRFAEDIVAAAARLDGRDLDYSIDSLRGVDEILGSWHHGGADVGAIGESIFGFGCYVGEVLVRALGADWVELEDSEAERLGGRLVVRGQDGVVWNPIGKAFKRVTNGSGDSVYAFAQLVASG